MPSFPARSQFELDEDSISIDPTSACVWLKSFML